MKQNDIIQKLLDTYRAKNMDYGNSAHTTFVEFGEVATVVRISDKLSRLQSLTTSDAQVKDESVLDTIGDAITYLCMLAADIDCDDRSLPEADRLASTANIPQTEFYLEALKDSATEFIAPPVGMGYYRECLIAIWRGISNPELRVQEYMNLAQQLLAEYERRTE